VAYSCWQHFLNIDFVCVCVHFPLYSPGKQTTLITDPAFKSESWVGVVMGVVMLGLQS